MAGSDMTVATFTQEFYRSSGLNRESAVGREYAHHMWSLYAIYCVDHLDGRALACAEHIARRVLQIQKATRRNFKAPDFEGLDGIMRHLHMLSGVAQTPKFDLDVATTQRNEGLLLKNARLAREEEAQDLTRRQKGPADPKKKNKGKKGGKGDLPAAGDDDED